MKMKVLVLSTSRNTRGGITSVLKIYEKSDMWHKYHCRWIGTHRDGNGLRKIWYFARACVQFFFFLPFYNIVHFHISLPTTVKRKYPLFKIARLFGKKTVLHLHCGSQIDNIWNDKYQYMFEHCDCGILLSLSLKHKIEGKIGVCEKLKVIYNPCPIVTNTNKYEKKKAILFSGTLYEGKGYKDLIYAFAKVAKAFPDWKIVFAGNGEMETARNIAKELGISDRIELLGWVSGEDKHRAFTEASALCLPSYAEGFPMAVLDAWAYGLPVLTTPVGGIPDIADDGKNMLLFTPGDIDELAKCLDKIMRDEQLRLDLTKESEKLAVSLFNVNTICKQVGDIYESLK